MDRRDEINRRLWAMKSTWRKLVWMVMRRWGIKDEDVDEALSIVFEGTFLFLRKESDRGFDALVILNDMEANSLCWEARGRFWWAISEIARDRLRAERKQTRWMQEPTRTAVVNERSAKRECLDDLRENICEAIQRIPEIHQAVAWLLMYAEQSQRAFRKDNGLNRGQWEKLRAETKSLLAEAFREIERERFAGRRIRDEQH